MCYNVSTKQSVLPHTSRRRKKVLMAKSRNHYLYGTWYNMVSRTTKPKDKSYKNYGLQGVRVCNRWLLFSNFIEDMGERPKGMTLDRIDPYGDYEPSNCRWATSTIQAINRKPYVFTKSGHRGVVKVQSGRWKSYIKLRGREISLGRYDKLSDAVDARRKGEEMYFTPLLKPNKV